MFDGSKLLYGSPFRGAQPHSPHLTGRKFARLPVLSSQIIKPSCICLADTDAVQTRMATNRFAALVEEDSIDGVDSPNQAKPADKFDTTTLCAALNGARQVSLPAGHCATSVIVLGSAFAMSLLLLLCSVKQEPEAETQGAAPVKKQKITHRQPLVWVDLEMTGMHTASCTDDTHLQKQMQKGAVRCRS